MKLLIRREATATIIYLFGCQRSTVSSFYAALDNASNTLTSKHENLKLIGMGKIEEEWLPTAATNPLVNVTALELVLRPSDEVESTVIPKSALRKLPQLVPNGTVVILDGVGLSEGIFRNYDFCTNMQYLSRISWKRGNFHLHGACLGSKLREITLNNCVLEYYCDSYDRASRILSSNQDYESRAFLLSWCVYQPVEHLSMNDTTWSIDGEKHAITEEMFLKRIRGLPNLRWIKKDLTQESIAFLQQEHPDITFVQNE
jgi:hypothetical protein